MIFFSPQRTDVWWGVFMFTTLNTVPLEWMRREFLMHECLQLQFPKFPLEAVSKSQQIFNIQQQNLTCLQPGSGNILMYKCWHYRSYKTSCNLLSRWIFSLDIRAICWAKALIFLSLLSKNILSACKQQFLTTNFKDSISILARCMPPFESPVCGPKQPVNSFSLTSRDQSFLRGIFYLSPGSLRCLSPYQSHMSVGV